MKKTVKLFGIIALAAVIGFGVFACNNGGGQDDPDTPPQPLFSVSGEFKGAGTGNALFKAATDATVSRSARSATTTYEMNGELEDGDILFRLKGTYDPSDGSYILSAAGSFVRYTVNGNAGGATATLAVKAAGQDEWKSFIVSVTIKEVIIADGDATDPAGGIPEWARGYWEDKWTQENDLDVNSFEAWSYFDQWYYTSTRSSKWQGNWDMSATKYTVIEYEDIGNGVYDAIFAYPRYKGTKDQIKTAAEKFLKEELKINNAEFWSYDFAPWDTDVFFSEEEKEQGINAENTVVWYICINPDHGEKCGSINIINWDTFVAEVKEKAEIDEKDLGSEFYGKVYDGTDVSDKEKVEDWVWGLKDNVDAFFDEYNIKQKYYWGWFGEDYDESDDYLDRNYTCWAPSEDWETFWGKILYWIKWGGVLGFGGDWEKYEFSKWWADDYLNKYLMSHNVQPETWYSRARLYMQGDDFVFQYYNGDGIEGQEAEHSVPPCNTKSLSKIKGLAFDSDFLGWSYFYQRQRNSYRR